MPVIGGEDCTAAGYRSRQLFAKRDRYGAIECAMPQKGIDRDIRRINVPWAGKQCELPGSPLATLPECFADGFQHRLMHNGVCQCHVIGTGCQAGEYVL